ncbi:MAG TPA: cbb3-type cytochrome c oxidase subunit I [Desulfuromonadales bacterium]|nr:cbb3-type cytochrome c oxidase subunit I [Desulfuromonadales bacterium]
MTETHPAATNERGFLAPSGNGLFGWIFSTDHKRIGLLYMYAILTFFLVGVVLGLLIRLELIAPGETIVSAQTYNALFTLHGVIMIFLFIIPGIPAIFGNIFLPIHIGANDVAFPRLNLLSWWLYIGGAMLALASLFGGAGFPDTGWTFYVPFSIQTHTNVTLAAFAVFILGFSSILTGLNFITTVHRLRATGVTWGRLPLFVWTLYSTAWVQVLATPILGITLALILLERVLGAGLFDPAKGGDPILYQHLFWIYSHPAVYIMILPGMGIISEIIPVFARKHIFGYWAMALSGIAIAFAGSLVWAHHMFVSGLSDTAIFVFSLLTFVVAIPSAIKVFNWTATLYKGSIALDPPMLHALSFILLFSVGGLTGLVLGAAATNVPVHDTHFVVGHFHYTMFGGTGFAFFAGLHFWLPKIFGRMYNRKVATAAWAAMLVGFNTLYSSMMVVGLRGMPRRYYDYLPQFTTLNVTATAGSWVLGAGIFVMFANLFWGSLRGAPAGSNPWGGRTLEWTLSSPPPAENFPSPPVVVHGPYIYPEEPTP